MLQAKQLHETDDLAPEIYRQRAVIEGYPEAAISAEQISEYLKALSEKISMRVLTEPCTHKSPKYGWAGWIHWETSGAHFYAWEVPRLFFSVDVYSCKEFSSKEAARFTQDYFKARNITVRDF